MSLLMQPRVLIIGVLRVFFLVTFVSLIFSEAAIAQLGERQTEDLKVPGSIPGLGMLEASPAHGAMAADPCCGNVDVIQTVRRP